MILKLESAKLKHAIWLAVAVSLTGCGGGSSSTPSGGGVGGGSSSSISSASSSVSSTASSSSSSAPVTGLALPSSVSVVTATNAG